MKLFDILRTASANTFRSKLRTSLTIIAIFIGSFTLTLTNGLGSGISSYIQKQVDNLGAKDVMTIQSSGSEGGFGGSSDPKAYDPSKKVAATAFGTSTTVLTDADIAKIKKTPGIKSVEANLVVTPDYIEGANGKKFTVSANPYITGTNIDLATGKPLSNTATTNQALLPLNYVSSMGYKDNNQVIGKTVTIGVTNALGRQTTITATVAGVQQNTLTSAGGMNINSSLTQALYRAQTVGLPANSIDSYQILIAKFDKNYSDQQITDLKDRLKKAGYTGQTVDDQLGTFKSVINGIIAVLDAFAVIALLAAGFGIINTLLMSVQERTREIGLMKAMGMSAPKIFLLFSTEAIILGFWGSFLGVLVAEGVGRIVNQVASKGFLKDLTGLQLLSFPLQSVALVVGVVMVIAFFAGTLPAYRAARQNPIDALRYE